MRRVQPFLSVGSYTKKSALVNVSFHPPSWRTLAGSFPNMLEDCWSFLAASQTMSHPGGLLCIFGSYVILFSAMVDKVFKYMIHRCKPTNVWSWKPSLAPKLHASQGQKSRIVIQRPAFSPSGSYLVGGDVTSWYLCCQLRRAFFS